MNKSRQHGQAFVVAVLILAIGASAFFFYLANPATNTLKQNEQTTAAFAQAREALIGYASSHGTRPGALPCPDNNNDGNGESPSPNCPTYLGRLPWRSLGLPDIRDGNGERLWYALSPNFRNLNPPTGPQLNSDTVGQITADGAIRIVALLISPGAAVSGQIRDGANANLASNFLENGNENGSATNLYTSGNSSAFNDRLMPIMREQLMPPVELRVARELRVNLQQYYTTNGYYPFAAMPNTTTCSNNLYAGILHTASCTPASGVSLPDITLPPWFSANEWHKVLIYAVAPRCTPKIDATTTTTTSWYLWIVNIGGCIDLSFLGMFGFLCPLTTTTTTYAIDKSALGCNNTAAGPLLSVEAANNIQALLLPAGASIAAQPRPCTTLANCLEDIENTNGDYIFVRPQRSSTNNDNLVVVSP
jgi:type II secretory pathway pseudopilin PulG